MAGRLSDYNPRPDYRSTVTARERLYGDLDLRLLINSNTGDVQKYTDIDAIKYSLKNLILANHYERPFKPFVAGHVTGLLFENATRFSAIELKSRIETLITRYEKRVQLVSVDVTPNIDNNEFNVSITYRINSIEETADITFKRYR